MQSNRHTVNSSTANLGNEAIKTDVLQAKQAKKSCKKTGEGQGLYTHQMNMK